MATIQITTKFNIGDSVFGFVNGEIHNLIIDKIRISTDVSKSEKDNLIQDDKIVYLATTTDAKFNSQRIFYNESLYTKEEVKEYINKYFENYTND